ncbi:carbon-nitrogen hydrolase family protein [Leucobacter sp. W1153]|uniref:carbon-nitrogen hydrolase family protein n=1 Tax=Leucobacter sp. W1153 TaxID=3439064 RepID=UPI003F340046
MTDTAAPEASLTIAVWQHGSVPADVHANLEALDEAVAEAGDNGAHLLITPEMFITGYNIGERLAPLARLQPLERVREIAKRHQVGIVVGGPECAAHEDGTEEIFNAAWLIDDSGEVLARHRKIQLFGELDRDLFVAGNAPTTVATYRGFTIAMLVCFDVEFPEATRAAALAGAELIAVPTAQMEPFHFVNEHLIRVRAWESGVYLAYANQVGDDGDLTYVGRSVIADPLGSHLAEAGPAGSALLIATIERETLTRARAQSPYLSELRREVFQTPTAK